MFRDYTYHLKKKFLYYLSVGGGGKEQSGSAWTKPITNTVGAALKYR